MSKYDDAERFIEQQTTTKRTYVQPAPSNRAALLAAIPTECRGLIDREETAGALFPEEAAAKDLWLYMQIAEDLERVNIGSGPKRGERYYASVRGNLEKALGGSPVSKAALGEAGGGGGGGFVILTPLEADFVARLATDSVVRSLATRFVTASNVLAVSLENSGLSAYIVPETTTITDSLPTTTFAQQTIVTKVFAGFVTASNQTLQDEIVGLFDYLMAGLAEQFGSLEDRGALDGLNFTGVRVATGVNSMTSNNSVASGGAQPTWTELAQLAFLALNNDSRRGARFFMHPRTLLALTSALSTTGQPIVTYTGAPDGTMSASALGYPISTVASLSTAQSTYTTSSTIYFGPPTRVLFADVQGLQMTVDPYTLFSTAQSRISFTRRCGILVPVGSAWSFMRGVKA